jgi:threonine synthase
MRSKDYSLARCSRCNSILEVVYDYSKVRLPKGFKTAKITHDKYLPFLPIDSFRVKLKEGATPMVKKRLAGIDEPVFFKLETKNPTHSFKDRGSAVEISRAVELGFRKVSSGSTGNMGISIAKYAKMAGIKATIFISRDAQKKKIKLIMKNGAHEVRIHGDFNTAVCEAGIFAKRNGAFACGDYHYRKEGQKSTIFEIIEQMKYNVPDFVFIPIGNATLLAGIYKGLVEFRRFGLIKKFPRLIAVQSERCDPLVKAYNSGKPVRYVVPRTVADAIAVGYPTFGFEGVKALHATHGLAVAVSEDEIIGAVARLKTLGIGAETGGAAGFAGYAKLYTQDRKFLKGKRSVVIVSGNN